MIIPFALAAAAVCTPTTPSQLHKLVANADATELVFFASWCGDCRSHLTKPHHGATLLVAAFDEKPLAEKTLDALKVATRCVFDVGIAEHYGVKFVPQSIKITKTGQKLP